MEDRMSINKIKKILLNSTGMTIIEVMVAGAIGAALFLYINKAIMQVNKAQVRSERRMQLGEIKDNVKKILEDTDSWISNPDEDVPKKENNSNYYYFTFPGSEIQKVSYTVDEINEIQSAVDKGAEKFACPEGFNSCRVILFNYGGKLILVDDLKQLSGSHYKVAVITMTPDQDISRSFLPEFKAKIIDTNKEPSLRVRTRDFYVNSTGAKRNGNSSYIERNGVKIDIKSRTRCFTEFQKSYQNNNHGLNLCKGALSLAPIDCYKAFRKDLNLNSELALIACVGAKNLKPVECYRKAKNAFRGSETFTAILCSAAQSDMPVKCLEKIQSSGVALNSADPFKVCSRAQDLTPAECFVKLDNGGPENKEVALYLCPHHK